MAKSKGRKSAPVGGKIKTAVCLSPKAFRKLLVAGAVENMSQSDLVELLITRHLGAYTAKVDGVGLFADQAMVTVSAVESQGVNPSVQVQV